MDVRCPQCQTLYELDDEQVADRGVTLKCSQCQHVFRLGGQLPPGENQRRWMVQRREEGDIVYLSTFDALHDAIMSRTVAGKDRISRTGNKWVELRDVPEFQPMFQVIENISELSEASVATERSRTPAGSPAVATSRRKPHRERVRTAIQFGKGSKPPPAFSSTEEVTKKVGPSDVLPDDVAAEMGHPDLPDTAEEPAQEDIITKESTPVPAPAKDLAVPSDNSAEAAVSEPAAKVRVTKETADIGPQARAAQEAREELEDFTAPRRSPAGLWLVGALIVAFVIGFFMLSRRDSGGREQVAIGATEQPKEEEKPKDVGPQAREAGDKAVLAALEAAEGKNSEIWSQWHNTASTPFYEALDEAYTAADEATAGAELQATLKKARAALENGRGSEAIRLYEGVLEQDPKHVAAMAGAGWALLDLGRPDEAVARFNGSLGISQNGDAYIGLGTAYRSLGKLEEAVQAYDSYLGRFPNGPKASIASYQMEQLKKQLGQ